MSQEELASRVFVVRQTVSKWEKGLSVPDADALEKLAEALEVPVSRLLGAPVEQPKDKDELAEQLSRLNEQLVIRNRRSERFWRAVRTVFTVIGVLFLLFVAVVLLGFYLLRTNSVSGTDAAESDAAAYITYDEEAGTAYAVTTFVP